MTEKARGSAPRGAPTRAHAVFCIAARRNSRRPPPEWLEYLYPRDDPSVMHLRFAPSFNPMSHSPAPPPPLTNSTNNNTNSHSNSSPSQLAHILSTVLADNETLSKDLTAARARYERAEQTLALLKPPGAPADASSPPSSYPEAAVKTILDLQSRLDMEKAAREAADARMRAISEAWLEFDRYLQSSEVHLLDARSHFSQLLRDASTKPSFNHLPAYQPRRSYPHCLALHSPHHKPSLAPALQPVFPLGCVIAMTALRMPLPPNVCAETAAAILSRYVLVIHSSRAACRLLDSSPRVCTHTLRPRTAPPT
jgi:hypothetical protein